MPLIDFNAADLLTPDGKLEAGWFQGKTVDAVVQMIAGFIDDIPKETDIGGFDVATQYLAIEAWGYAQSFLWLKADYGSRTGTIVLPNEITAQTTKEAADTFAELAKYWLDTFYALVPTAVPIIKRPVSYSFTAGFRP